MGQQIAGEIVPRRNRTQIEWYDFSGEIVLWVRFHQRYRTQGTISPEISYPDKERIYNDKADNYPQHGGKFFNFRIFIEYFIHEVKKTYKFRVSGPYLDSKYQ